MGVGGRGTSVLSENTVIFFTNIHKFNCSQIQHSRERFSHIEFTIKKVTQNFNIRKEIKYQKIGPRQANLVLITYASSEGSGLLAHTSSESRGTFRQKARSLAPLNGWACAVKICHDGMLEDTNLLDAAQLRNKGHAKQTEVIYSITVNNIFYYIIYK